MEALVAALTQLEALEARVQDLVDPALAIGEALKVVVKEGAIVIGAIHERVEELESATPGTASPVLTELAGKVDGLVTRLSSIDSSVSSLSSRTSAVESNVSTLTSALGTVNSRLSSIASDISTLYARTSITPAPVVDPAPTPTPEPAPAPAAAPATTDTDPAAAPAEGSGT